MKYFIPCEIACNCFYMGFGFANQYIGNFLGCILFGQTFALNLELFFFTFLSWIYYRMIVCVLNNKSIVEDWVSYFIKWTKGLKRSLIQTYWYILAIFLHYIVVSWFYYEGLIFFWNSQCDDFIVITNNPILNKCSWSCKYWSYKVVWTHGLLRNI